MEWLFAAAQAAQKMYRLGTAFYLPFAAAQAAQKMEADPNLAEWLFAAAQAAQKLVISVMP